MTSVSLEHVEATAKVKLYLDNTWTISMFSVFDLIMSTLVVWQRDHVVRIGSPLVVSKLDRQIS